METLTKEQIKGNLDAIIERLTKQKDVLEAQVKSLADQTNDLYAKRQKAAQEAEAFDLELKAKEKKLQDQLEDVRKNQKEIEKQNQELIAKRTKLNEDKEIFRKERQLWVEREGELQTKEKNFTKKLAEVEKKERDATEEKENLEIRDAALSKLRTDLINQEDKLAHGRAQLLKDQEELSIKEKEWQKEIDKAVKEKNLAESRLEDGKKELLQERTTFLQEKGIELESLRKRELEVVRKEKQVRDLELEIKARLENLEIKEGKPEEAPKRKKKGE